MEQLQQLVYNKEQKVGDVQFHRFPSFLWVSDSFLNHQLTFFNPKNIATSLPKDTSNLPNELSTHHPKFLYIFYSLNLQIRENSGTSKSENSLKPYASDSVNTLGSKMRDFSKMMRLQAPNSKSFKILEKWLKYIYYIQCVKCNSDLGFGKL